MYLKRELFKTQWNTKSFYQQMQTDLAGIF